MKSIIRTIVPETVRQKFHDRQRRKQWEGDAFECNFCGAKLKEFTYRGVDSEVIQKLKIVPAGRRQVTCPFCASYDRDRLLWLFLQHRTDLTKVKTILHMAPEETIASKLRSFENIEYMSGDLDPALAMMKVDVTDIPFPDSHFDAILCNHVLEHVPDDSLAMRELLRVTKPGGWAVLQVPIGIKLDHTIEDIECHDEAERLARFGQIDHFRVYAKEDYVARLRKAGWQVEVVDLISEISEEDLRRLSLNKDEKIFFCKRPI